LSQNEKWPALLEFAFAFVKQHTIEDLIWYKAHEEESQGQDVFM
jgi:hypothetical protein